MSQIHKHTIPANITDHCLINPQQYKAMYQQSINIPDTFWGKQGKILDWIKPYQKVKNTSFAPSNVSIKWYKDSTLNLAANCLDHHLQENSNHTTIIWEGNNTSQSKHISYKELHHDICHFTNTLLKLGIKKGDVVAIYMPMVPEATVAMLACTHIGTVHSVIFSSFSPEAIARHIIDSNSQLVITSNKGVHARRSIPLKKNIDDTLKNPNITSIEHVVVLKHTGRKIDWQEGHDLWWHNLVEQASNQHQAEEINTKDPLFILYTSSSTSKPKGVLHTTSSYLVYTALTFKYVFDYHPGDIYWCTTNVGWVTRHSYLLYSPLAYSATTLMFEGIPNWPTPAHMAQVVDKHQVNILYTTPTAIHALMAEGDKAIEGTNQSSLHILSSMGKPINPEAWEWYWKKISNKKCPVVNTWWQTKTGSFMITPLPGTTKLKASSATHPFFSMQPALVNNKGNPLEGTTKGSLVITNSWPGQAHTLFGNHKHFEQTYFSTFKNMYFSSNSAHHNEDGYYWITRHVDNVLNISSHHLGTAEIESALVAHPKIAKATIVGIPHNIKGQAIYTYITLNHREEPSPELYTEVHNWVHKEIGPLATPDMLHWTNSLPKTHSSKIMHHILHKITAGNTSNLGNTSTLANPGIVKKLLEEKQAITMPS